MKRIVPILIAAIAFGGCKWLPSRRKSKVIRPSHEYPQNWPASAPAPAPSPPPTDSRPATTTAPATTATTTPSGYRVIGKPEVVAAAMLQVNDKFITLEQVLHPIRRELMAAGRGGGGDFRRRAGALIQSEIRRQVQQTLILEEARRRLSEEEMKFVEKELLRRHQQALAEFDGSETLLAQRLKDEGTALPAWQDEMRRALTVRVYLERSLLPQVAVNRKMMWDYYNGHIKEFRRPATVEIQLIEVPFSDYVTTRPATEAAQQAARRKAREQIDAAVAALAGGEDFAKVAGKFSKGPMAAKGGVWPPLERGSLRADAVETAAFSQKEGQVSGVIETPTGCYVVKTLRHRPGEKAAFEQVQAKIEAKLRMQQYEKISGEYMRKVYSRAVIRGADAFEEAALDAAVKRYSR